MREFTTIQVDMEEIQIAGEATVYTAIVFRSGTGECPFEHRIEFLNGLPPPPPLRSRRNPFFHYLEPAVGSVSDVIFPDEDTFFRRIPRPGCPCLSGFPVVCFRGRET